MKAVAFLQEEIEFPGLPALPVLQETSIYDNITTKHFLSKLIALPFQNIPTWNHPLPLALCSLAFKINIVLHILIPKRQEIKGAVLLKYSH